MELIAHDNLSKLLLFAKERILMQKMEKRLLVLKIFLRAAKILSADIFVLFAPKNETKASCSKLEL